MADDVLGHNPLDEGVDSIWKVPKKSPKIQQPMPVTPPAPEEPAKKTSAPAKWEPIAESIEQEPSRAENSLSQEPMPSARADNSAEVFDEEHVVEETIQLVGFRLGEELFGIDIMDVQEIIRVRDITRVPRTTGFVMGVVNLRGRVIPVINLNKRFQLNYQEFLTGNQRIIIVNTEVGTIGFDVDEVTEVFRIPESIIVPPPPSSTRLDSKYIVGVGRLEEKLLVILNLDELISSSKMVIDS